jgi:hypothetical protein
MATQVEQLNIFSGSFRSDSLALQFNDRSIKLSSNTRRPEDTGEGKAQGSKYTLVGIVTTGYGWEFVRGT